MTNEGVAGPGQQVMGKDSLAGNDALANGLKGCTSEDKTGIQLSKQQTIKGNSLVGEDDSSSSDSSSDDSNIFGQGPSKSIKASTQVPVAP